MSYFDEPKKSQKEANANKYVKIVTGVPTIVQVIDTSAVNKWQHWLKDSQGRSVSVKCLGKGVCPVCNKNAQLGPNAYKHPSYIKIQRRYMVNVVNLTPVKRGSDGEAYLPMKDKNGKLVYPATDAKGNSLEDALSLPMNEVQILERGPELFAQLEALNNSVRDPKDPFNGEILGLTNYPVQIVATGEGREMKLNVAPMTGSPYTINPKDYDDKKIDLTATFAFTADEVQSILDGVAVSDIVAARIAQDAQAKPDLTYDIQN